MPTAFSSSMTLFAATHRQRYHAGNGETECPRLGNSFEAEVLCRTALERICLVRVCHIGLTADEKCGDHVVCIGQAGDHCCFRVGYRIKYLEAIGQKTARPNPAQAIDGH